jgi:RecJ-like exonuclease
MLILKCKRCKGTGRIPNEKYELCKTMRSEEAIRYFGITEIDDSKDCEEWIRAGCGLEETVSCPICQGAGSIAYRDRDWELTIVPEDEGEE